MQLSEPPAGLASGSGSGSSDPAGPSSSKAADGNATAAAAGTPGRQRRAKKARGGVNGAGGAGAATEEDLTEEQALLRAQGFWTCSTCTFSNTDLSATSCDVCGEARADS